MSVLTVIGVGPRGPRGPGLLVGRGAPPGGNLRTPVVGDAYLDLDGLGIYEPYTKQVGWPTTPSATLSGGNSSGTGGLSTSDVQALIDSAFAAQHPGGLSTSDVQALIDSATVSLATTTALAGKAAVDASNISSAATWRTALGLGTASTQATGAFDGAGAAAAAQAASQPLNSDLTAISGLGSATAGALATDGAGWVRKTYAQLKTALGLVKGDVGLGNVDNTADTAKPVSTAQATAIGTAQAAATAAGAAAAPVQSVAGLTGTPTAAQLEAAGLLRASTASATYQPVDSDLTAIAALSTTTYGRALLTLADAAAGRTAFGLGTAATHPTTDFADATATSSALAAKADLVAGLVPTSQIPALALTTAVTVASQAAMLALTTSQVQPGDLAVRTDGAGTFILTATDPSVLGNWTRLNAPTDAVTTVNGQTGTVVLAATDVGAQPVDSDLTAIAALTTTAYGRAFLALADAAAARTALGLATVATSGAYTDLSGKPIVGYTPTAKTANYTAADGDLVLADATGGAFNVTLPTPTAGRRVATKKTDASTNAVSVITGSGTVSLAVQNQTQEFVADGSVWHSIARPGVTSIAATGTASGTTYLRGDGSWATPAGGSSLSGVPAVVSTPRSGSTYSPYMPSIGIGNTSLGNGVLSGAAIEFASSITLSALMAKAPVAGSTGSVIRLGIYTNSNGRPGTLVLDAGTFDATNTADASIAISQTFPAGVYWFVAVSQGAPTTDPQVRSTNAPTNGTLTDGFLGNPLSSPYVSGYTGYSTTGITGALPASLTAATWTGQQKTYLVFPKAA